MTDIQKLIMWTMLILTIGCVLIGLGTNWKIGAGIFFILWASAGLLEIAKS